MRYVLQGMLKTTYWCRYIPIPLKANSILFSAVPAIGFNYLTLNVQYHPEHIKRYDITVKKSDLWNKYYGHSRMYLPLSPSV